MLKRLAEGYAAAKAADPLELEQSRIRICMYGVVLVCELASFFWDGILEENERINLLALACVFLPAVAHLGWILTRPGVNDLRRRIAVWMDMGAITVGMVRMGEAAILFYGLYHWVVIGNGFRYGRRYLYYAQVVALVGVASAVVLDPYLQEHYALTVGYFVMLVAIPWYFSLLLARLHAARVEAEAANTAKTKFLAAASHDLRQPMQALSMYVAVLEERLDDADALRVVHGVQMAVRTLEQLFDGVLDISKIESGVIKPHPVVFPLMPLIDRVIEAEIPIAGLKNLALRAVPTSAGVRSDPALLERMLKNLVTNAIRYTDRGGIVVGCRRAGDGRLRLEVVDTGIGIPVQEQKRIFDEYYQLEGASAQGLGLGLPIVKSLGELLGHPVTVRSAIGRGSVFAIELERADAMAASENASAAPPFVRGVNVALVDDDAEIRESMRLLFESWGCACFAGATAAAVEEELQARSATPDALIVDYRLADAMTGLQVIERLRIRFGAHLPALVITGTPNATLIGHQLAGIPFATKPVARGKLRAFLSQVARKA